MMIDIKDGVVRLHQSTDPVCVQYVPTVTLVTNVKRNQSQCMKLFVKKPLNRIIVVLVWVVVTNGLVEHP